MSCHICLSNIRLYQSRKGNRSAKQYRITSIDSTQCTIKHNVQYTFAAAVKHLKKSFGIKDSNNVFSKSI